MYSAVALTAGGLGSGLAFYTYHAMKGTEIKHAIQYCRAQELGLIENTRAKKGSVVEDFESISAIIKQNAKDEGINYRALVTLETFRDHDIKMMYALTLSTIAASAIGMYMMLSPTSEQAVTPTGRKEDIEQNNGAVITNEGQSTQPPMPMLAR